MHSAPHRLAAATAFLFCGSIHAETVWLSSLDLTQMTAGWSVPKADKSVIGKPISIGGNFFAKGVGTHAHSSFRVKLGGGASRFRARVGISDGDSANGSVQFIVMADGKELGRSETILHGDEPAALDLDLTGTEVLTLIVRDGGDGTNDDHAVWADAVIVMKPGAPQPLASHDTHMGGHRDITASASEACEAPATETTSTE